MNNFRGDLTDTSIQKASLVISQYSFIMGRSVGSKCLMNLTFTFNIFQTAGDFISKLEHLLLKNDLTHAYRTCEDQDILVCEAS